MLCFLSYLQYDSTPTYPAKDLQLDTALTL